MGLSNKLVILFLTGFVFYVGQLQAYTKPLDQTPYVGIEDSLSELHETTQIADKIWTQLTNEFVQHYENGDFTMAADAAITAYNLSITNFGSNHINTADSLLKMGIVKESLGDYENAKFYMQQALNILKQELGMYHEDIAIVLTNIANVYFEQNKPVESERLHKKALDIRLRTLGDNDPAVAQSMYNLAVLYDDLTKYDEAIPLYENALQIWNSNYGAVHPYIANALNNLANLYMEKELVTDAIELHKHSLSIRRSLYGDEHAEVARALINLGALYVKQNSYEQAKPLYIEAVEVAEKLFGPKHPQVAMLLYSLANIYHIQGRLAKAETDTNSQKVANKITKESKTLKKTAKSNFEQAVPLYERALEILDGSMGENHPAVTAMLNELALLYKSIGNRVKAEQMLARLSHGSH